MTPHDLIDEELRVEVAILDGYSNCKFSGIFNPIQLRGTLDGVDFLHVPNYPLDLNAIAKVEASLSDEQHEDFRDQLFMVASEVADAPYAPSYSTAARNRAYVSSTARQRCIALLLTKGWTR